MLSNYFKIAWRSLIKTPMFTNLNIFGLGLGLAVSLLLFLHVKQELTFDAWHTKADRIHRVILNAFWDPTKPEMVANAPNAVGPAMKAAIPAVEQSARLLKHNFGESAFITAGNNKLVEEKLFWADPEFFDIFDVEPLYGDLTSALTLPNTIVLSHSAAMRYFGTANPVGKSLVVDQGNPLEVKAVFKDLPGNCSWNINAIGSFKTVKWASEQLVWSNASFETFVLLGPGADKAQVERQMADLLDKNVAKQDQRFSLWLQPLRDVHLYSSEMRYSYTERLGDPKQTNILGVLALAVLLIACFNYMNLSTARAQMRFREVGINKTMGASRRQLALRFYAETVLLTAVALLLAFGILAVAIPKFNQLADKNISVDTIFQFDTLSAILAVWGGVVLIAGSYPAFFLSRYQPKNLLQTAFRKDTGAGWLRRFLVTAQFSASVVLVIGTLVLNRQMHFIQQKQLGFSPEQVVAVTTIAAKSKEQLDALMQGCRQVTNVEAVCRAQTFPGRKASVRTMSKPEDPNSEKKILTNRTSPGFEKVLNIKLLAGKTLPDKLPDDTIVNVVMTQSAVAYYGWKPEEAIGQQVECNLGPNAYICGVVEDFHAESLHKPIGAYAFHDASTETRRFMLVKMNTANIKQTMQQLESAFHQALPESAFEYQFVDEHLERLYRNDARTARVVFVFSLFSIFVSCLGLFGLTAFAAEQRTKEIGIRKVLGASVAGITGLLAKDFVKLVVIAILVASPLGYYIMQKWLSDFAYHIDIQWWLFVVAGAIAFVVVFTTVGFQAVRAALMNPINALRNDS